MGIVLAQDNKFVKSLIQNAKQGNNASFEQLMKLHIEQVYAISLRLLADFALAEEITKKVCIKTWEQISYIREDAAFGIWLTGIAVYNSLEFLRTNKSKNKTTKLNKPLYQAIGDELLLDNAIIALPEDERIIFVLHFIFKYTPDEIADMLFKKKSEVIESLKTTRNNLNNVRGPESVTLSFEERISALPIKIAPAHDLWPDIFKELLRLRTKPSNVSNVKLDETEEVPEKKKGFHWFRKK